VSALAGRKIWLAGIGGAGMSAYALIAKAWGAEVSGWDKAETPYLTNVRAAGIPVEIAPEPTLPGSELERYVSTALSGASRAGPAPSCWPSCLAAQVDSRLGRPRQDHHERDDRLLSRSVGSIRLHHRGRDLPAERHARAGSGWLWWRETSPIAR